MLRAEVGAPAATVLQLGEIALRLGHGVPVPPRPAELPPRPAGFVGRRREIAAIAHAAAPASGMTGVLVTGRPGVGKTALAVEAAHRLGDLFPDGVLCVGPRDRLSAYEMTGRLLNSLGVSPGGVPDRPGPRLAAYHRALAERRALVLFDDVTAATRVAPLLPAGSRSFALLTARHTLPGLPAGVVRLCVGDLDAADAQRLLGDAVGAELDGVGQLVRVCAGLPLALRIVAARLATEPGLSPARLAGLLAHHPRVLGELRAGERAVQAAFATSYDDLGPMQRSLFRRLAAAPLCDITAGAAAALAGEPEERAGTLLRGLHDAQLLDPSPGGAPGVTPTRYRLHDLLRRYAEELLLGSEPPAAVAAARDRLTRHYIALLDRPPDRCWFIAERENLLVVADLLGRTDPAGHEPPGDALAGGPPAGT